MNESGHLSSENTADASAQAPFMTLGARHRADQIEVARPTPTPSFESIIYADSGDMPFTRRHRSAVRERLGQVENPITRRELRQQEREAYIKNHPIRHLGYRALYGALKPFSK